MAFFIGSSVVSVDAISQIIFLISTSALDGEILRNAVQRGSECLRDSVQMDVL